MSILSAQCDELRIMANISELPDGVRLALRQAADTIWELRNKANAELDVLQDIDQLRRDLSGYHGQLKAHNDLQRHCDNQREQLEALNAAHKPIKDERDAYKKQAARFAAENAKLRECVLWLWSFAKTCGVDADDLRKHGVEVDE